MSDIDNCKDGSTGRGWWRMLWIDGNSEGEGARAGREKPYEVCCGGVGRCDGDAVGRTAGEPGILCLGGIGDEIVLVGCGAMGSVMAAALPFCAGFALATV